MQYKVPQFIEVEDKIFGPLTFKQFLYLAGGGGAALAFVTLLPLWLAIPLGVPFVAAGAALAFYKVNDRPLIVTLEHAFSYSLGSKLYLWQHRETALLAKREKAAVAAAAPALPIAKFSESKLKDLAWALNIKERLAQGEEE